MILALLIVSITIVIINIIFIILAEIVQPNAASVPLDKTDVYDRTIIDMIMNVNEVSPVHFPTENSFVDESLSVEEKPGALVTDIVLNNSTEVV